MMVQGQYGENINEILISTKTLNVMVHSYYSRYAGGISKKTGVHDPIRKITEAKRAGAVDQVVKSFPNKHVALSS
jgi:hypothetical protein